MLDYELHTFLKKIININNYLYLPLYNMLELAVTNKIKSNKYKIRQNINLFLNYFINEESSSTQKNGFCAEGNFWE